MTEIELIAELLGELAPFAREKYRNRGGLRVSSKRSANDLLTEVDLAVQDRIVERVRAEFPGDEFAAEERDLGHGPADPDARCWVIDPIDGTQNFVRGLLPAFGISVAFSEGGRGVAGGVSLPMLNEVYLAELGAGATRNGARIWVSDVSAADVARVEVDFVTHPESAETVRRARRVLGECGQIRCNCSAVVALCSVACGEMEGFFHVSLHPWDYAAGQLLVEEAGGKCTRLDGSPLELFDNGRGVLASNGKVHGELLGMVEE